MSRSCHCNNIPAVLKRVGKRVLSALTLRNVLPVFAALFVVATFLLFLEALLSGEAPPALGKKPVHVRASSTARRGVGCNYSESKAHLRLVVIGFDPHTAAVTVSAGLCFPNEAFAHLYVEAKHGKPHPVLTASGHLIGRYARLPISVVYFPAGEQEGAEESPQSATTSLGALFHRAEDPLAFPRLVSLGQFTLPVFATPQKYPFDQYGLSDEFAVADLNLNLFYCTKSSKCEDVMISSTVEVFAESNLAPFELFASYQVHEDLPKVTLRLERTTTKQIYVVMVAVIPLFLGFLLMLLLATRPTEDIGTAILGIGAVLLAILPIRLVLVPAEVNELTLVDYWLAVEMAALSALAAFGAWRALGDDGESHPS